MHDTPRWFRPVAIVALLWNLLGCLAFLSDALLSADDVAKLSAAQQALHAARPPWSIIGTAVAVWGGALGSLALATGRRWASPLLAASLAGVLVQDIWLFGLSTAAGGAGPAAFVLQGLVLVVAVALVMLGRRASGQGWLKR